MGQRSRYAREVSHTRAASQPLTGYAVRWFLPAAVVSLLTMPVSALWFLLVGPLVFMGAAVVALAQRDPDTKSRAVVAGTAFGLGVLTGPAVYLVLAALTA